MPLLNRLTLLACGSGIATAMGVMCRHPFHECRMLRGKKGVRHQVGTVACSFIRVWEWCSICLCDALLLREEKEGEHEGRRQYPRSHSLISSHLPYLIPITDLRYNLRLSNQTDSSLYQQPHPQPATFPSAAQSKHQVLPNTVQMPQRKDGRGAT